MPDIQVTPLVYSRWNPFPVKHHWVALNDTRRRRRIAWQSVLELVTYKVMTYNKNGETLSVGIVCQLSQNNNMVLFFWLLYRLATSAWHGGRSCSVLIAAIFGCTWLDSPFFKYSYSMGLEHSSEIYAHFIFYQGELSLKKSLLKQTWQGIDGLFDHSNGRDIAFSQRNPSLNYGNAFAEDRREWFIGQMSLNSSMAGIHEPLMLCC